MVGMTVERALSFGSLADAYERWRPGYPAEAVRWLVPSTARRVLDIGAGTGKLSRAVLATGASVVAVEPDQAMAAVLRRAVPGAEVRSGSAAALPVGDGSVDAVVVGQAWHWFPVERAVAEIRRVTGAGGQLGLVWNAPVRDVDWADAVAALDPGHGQVDGVSGEQLPVGLPPEDLESEIFTWDWEVTPEQVTGCLSTHSGLIVMEPAERADRLRQIQAIAEAAADPISGTLLWRHRARCFRLAL